MTIAASLLVLALLAPQEAASTRTLRASVMIAAGVADALTTRDALTSGRGHEGNPLMRWPSQSTPRLLIIKTAVNGSIAWVLAKWVAPENRALAWGVALGVSALQFGVAWHNARVGR